MTTAPRPETNVSLDKAKRSKQGRRDKPGKRDKPPKARPALPAPGRSVVAVARRRATGRLRVSTAQTERARRPATLPAPPKATKAARPAEEEEGEGAKKDRPRKKERPREQRERPAFNLGDIVFGKITEITPDALFVDLSGKGRGIFDRRELDLPDDLEYGADPEQMDEEFVGETEHAAPGEAADAEAGTEATGEPVAEAAAADAVPPSERETVAEAVVEAGEATTHAEPASAEPAQRQRRSSAAAASARSPRQRPEIEARPREAKRESTDFPHVTLELGLAALRRNRSQR